MLSLISLLLFFTRYRPFFGINWWGRNVWGNTVGRWIQNTVWDKPDCILLTLCLGTGLCFVWMLKGEKIELQTSPFFFPTFLSLGLRWHFSWFGLVPVPPVVIKNDSRTWEEIRHYLCKENAFDNIVISPGPGSPKCPSDIGMVGRCLAVQLFLPLILFVQ